MPLTEVCTGLGIPGFSYRRKGLLPDSAGSWRNQGEKCALGASLRTRAGAEEPPDRNQGGQQAGRTTFSSHTPVFSLCLTLAKPPFRSKVEELVGVISRGQPPRHVSGEWRMVEGCSERLSNGLQRYQSRMPGTHECYLTKGKWSFQI